ncbi:hypothetical protein QBC45DRAFT_323222, partial [Copromyces sp. CBS 386.78]
GQIFDKAIYDISKKDFAARLLYITISRIRTLQNIIFKEIFEFNSLRIKTN